jgi:serine/threonine protein kinase
VNIIWSAIDRELTRKGSSFYLCEFADVMMRTICTLYPVLDIHSVRVHLAAVSTSPVFYITPPTDDSVATNAKAFAFKVVENKTKFDKEVSFLKRIKRAFSSCYYVSDSTTLETDNRTLTCTGDYDWFQLATWKKKSSYGVIVMKPGSRLRITDVDDTDGSVYSQLFQNLQIVHQCGIVHGDISTRNFVQFKSGWQIIDFEFAAEIVGGDEYLDRYGMISNPKGTYRHYCCGYRAYEMIQSADASVVEWTIANDLEMLQYACRCGNQTKRKFV